MHGLLFFVFLNHALLNRWVVMGGRIGGDGQDGRDGESLGFPFPLRQTDRSWSVNFIVLSEG
jgi:hypothetical protein